MDMEFENKIALLTERETAYTADAYHFVAEAVNYTVGKLPEHRHVSAFELLKGARKMAMEQYGAVAREVLRSFGIKTASDVGKIVYLLISVNLLSSSEDDSPEDFNIDFEPVPEVCNAEISVEPANFSID